MTHSVEAVGPQNNDSYSLDINSLRIVVKQTANW